MDYKIKIMIVDDHVMVASGLSAELKQLPDFEISDVVTEPDRVMNKLEAINPDAILMDIRMGAFNGLHMADEIKKSYPEIKIILMSGYNMGQLAKNSKADAFTSKEEPVTSLAATIRKVCLEKASVFPNAKPWEETLTNTEVKVLQLIGEDMTRKEIASALYISEKTVANHISAILQKLCVRSRIGAVLRGVELGYIDNNFG